jgi:hypothetical protein
MLDFAAVEEDNLADTGHKIMGSGVYIGESADGPQPADSP